MKRGTLSAAIVTALVCALLATPPANADTPAKPTTESQPFTSQSCLQQVRAIAKAKDVSSAAAAELCSGMVTLTESAPQTATVADIMQYAQHERLGPRDTKALVAVAAAGGIKYRIWTHTYWGGSLVEKHTGRTYWDGIRAWISTYRGYTGSHTCHAEGGVAVGWAVKPISCTRPTAGASADAFYRFDASVAFSGSPITVNVGLHYSMTAAGVSSGWQIGG